MIEQSIRLRLEKRGIPADVARDAAKLIAPTLSPDSTISEASTALLLQTFVELYRMDYDGEAALRGLSDNLIK